MHILHVEDESIEENEIDNIYIEDNSWRNVLIIGMVCGIKSILIAIFTYWIIRKNIN